MNWKKGLTIGLLAITTIGLVGCAIILGKKNPAYKPKVQTDAYYNVTNYNYNTDEYTITGYTNEGRTYLDANKYINVCPTVKYTVQYNGTNTYVKIETIQLDTADDTWEINNPILTEYNFYNIEPQRITIEYTGLTDEPEEWYIYYAVRINTNRQENNTKITNPEIPLENSDGLELEYSNFNQTLTTLNNTYQTGFTTGYQNKGDLIDGNFIDIRNMMLSVLTMPFTFINQAFNVTLWEGTAYAFNIGNFIKGLIAIASILFIIKLFTSGFSILGNYTGNIIARNDAHRLSRSQRKLNKAKAKQIKENKPEIRHTYVHKDE